jgi:zinc protease
MKKNALIFLSLILVSGQGFAKTAPPPSPSVSPTTPEKVYNAQAFTLPNGLEVILIENHGSPVVTHMLWYKVGAADEPQGDGVSGEAHFLEHLMFKGTKAVGPGKFSRLIRSMGGNDNAFTSWDYTSFHQSVAKERLPIVMAMEADRMINLDPPQKEIEPEHQVIMEERRQRTDNDPKALFSEQIRSVLYNATPYGIPIIGWKEEMPKITWDLSRNYYKKWYAPNNAILIVSGDVTLPEMKTLAEKYYGFLPRKDIPQHIRPDVPAPAAPMFLEFHDKAVQQAVYMKAAIAPSFVQDKKDAYALEVLQNVISGGASTKLYQSLVVKQKVAVDIDMNYDEGNRGQGSIWIYATPAEGVSLKKLEAAINNEFRGMIKNGIGSDEIAKAKNRMIDSSIYARDSVTGPAMDVGQALAAGATLDDVEYWPARINETTPEEVGRVLKKYLDPDHPDRQPVTGYMVPPGVSP